MKAHIKSNNGRVVVEVEGESVKDLFEQLALVQEILDSDSACGACGDQRIRFRVRVVAKFKYYELHCGNCNASLSFGQRKDGALFPKRKDDAKNPLANRGWTRRLASGNPTEE